MKTKMNDFINSFYKAMGSNRVAVSPEQVVTTTAPVSRPSVISTFLNKYKPTAQPQGESVTTPDKYGVDWNFIEGLEGTSLKGYVPKNSKTGEVFGNSGVTVGSGFDLGQHSLNDLKGMGLPQPIIDKLSPYLGKTKAEATKILRANPLRLSEEELNLISPKVKQTALSKLITKYNQNAKVPFEKLSKEQQTVLASVAFQYGDLSSRTPNFWKNVTNNDWASAYKNLLNFGDKYQTRRIQEAKYLAGNTDSVV